MYSKQTLKKLHACEQGWLGRELGIFTIDFPESQLSLIVSTMLDNLSPNAMTSFVSGKIHPIDWKL